MSSAQTKVSFGFTSWQQGALVASKKFYPPNAKTGVDQLTFYANQYPCVEVDSSHYAMPTERRTKEWAAAVPKGFLFHVKVFGLFAKMKVPVGAIPRECREGLPVAETSAAESSKGEAQLSYEDLDDDTRDKLWSRYVEGMRPLADAKKLGCVLFQFQLNFAPTDGNRAYLEECVDRLSALKTTLVCEFRHKAWSEQQNLSFLLKNGIGLVLTDDDSTSTQNVNFRDVLSTTKDSSIIYFRLHRRYGDYRLLDDREIGVWRDLLKEACQKPTRKVFVLVGTDAEDHTLLNTRRLEQAIAPDGLADDWREQRKQANPLLRMLRNAAAAKAAKQEQTSDGPTAESAAASAGAGAADAGAGGSPGVKRELEETDEGREGEAEGAGGDSEKNETAERPKKQAKTASVSGGKGRKGGKEKGKGKDAKGKGQPDIRGFFLKGVNKETQ
ncbi:unnamed protein product [Vitrella brassicaformis CCMP3155]|uniref:DUF72 domain-containing protein n=1 Tax=Vitrella brassicaformis (strain CCMP3155) TaxID=1169540 RepID=A0A0G4F3F6_VITBC|nr:unnamed protein product [Vitrella brassicaformis CCMP3155]|eukprot:CEM06361.1 unnamed protein product [Vitrella brassicaformis CCMP3155]